MCTTGSNLVINRYLKMCPRDSVVGKFKNPGEVVVQGILKEGSASISGKL